MVTQEMKMEMFAKVLELENLSATKTYDGHDYYEQADGAFQILQILGLESEYIEWAEGRI